MASGVADYITATGALLGGAGALVAGVAAWRALNTWRAQLRGEARFDTAKRLLTAAHDLAHQFHAARSPLISAGEFPAEYRNEPNTQQTAAERADAYAHVFNARWEPVRVSCLGIVGLLPEVRALLPPEVAKYAETLLDPPRELQGAMEFYVVLQRMDVEGDLKSDQHLQEEWRRVRGLVYASAPKDSVDPDNPLSKAFMERHKVLIEALKPHIEDRA